MKRKFTAENETKLTRLKFNNVFVVSSMNWAWEKRLLMSRNPLWESNILADQTIDELYISNLATPKWALDRLALSSGLLETSIVFTFKFTRESIKKYF